MTDKEIEVYDAEPEDECPVCKNGTLEDNGTEVQCRGECGSIFRKVLVRV